MGLKLSGPLAFVMLWMIGSPLAAENVEQVQPEAPDSPAMSVPAKPSGNPSNWIRPGDYPKPAMRANRQGVVEFVVTINPEGRVTDCLVTGSSGHKDLDDTVCTQMKRRAKFEPATDTEGKPTTGTWSSKFIWSILI